jgi:D-alanine-D-alanine ligase
VGIIFGGKSCEHEISLLSAKNIIEALDKEKYEPVLIGIDKQGGWHIKDPSCYLNSSHDPKQIQLFGSSTPVALATQEGSNSLLHLRSSASTSIDVIFPVLHGTYGEDGTVQGLLKLAGIPFVGAGVLGSAIGMDKDVMKRLLKEANIPSAKYLCIRSFERDLFSYEQIIETLGSPVFVKPANAGSSVGVAKVKNSEDFKKAVDEAFLYDKKIIVEEFIAGREIECSVLGNESPIASIPGEIIPTHEFYSYAAKYLDENGAKLEIPAKLSEDVSKKIQEMAVLAFQVLCCEGMARVDFFLQESGKIYVNEINTIPGFTKISMYPKLWQESGLSYTDLLDKLIQLALQKHTKEASLQTKYDALTLKNL